MLLYCPHCQRLIMDDLLCTECDDWINADWIDGTPSLLARFNDGGVVCSYKDVTAIIKDTELPNLVPYNWLKEQVDTNPLLSGMPLNRNRQYALDIDGLIDAILLDVLDRDKAASSFFDCINLDEDFYPVIR